MFLSRLMYSVCRYDTPQCTWQTGWTWNIKSSSQKSSTADFLEEILKSYKPEFYESTTLLRQVLCRKYYISMYLGEYLPKLWLSVKSNFVRKNTLTPWTLKFWHNYEVFSIFFYFARCTNLKGLMLARKHSCQICIDLATDSQNLDRLNGRLSEVLITWIVQSKALYE